MLRNELLVKTFTAQGAIAPHRVVTFGTGTNSAAQASAASETLFGVSDSMGAVAGDTVDVVLAGIVPVKAGAAITKGTYVTTNGTGQIVAASAGNRIIGMTMEGAAAGDLVPVLLATA